MDLSQLNLWAVLVAIAAYFVLGGLWYTVFGNAWMKAVGFTRESISAGEHGPAGRSYMIAGLVAILVVLAMALTLTFTGPDASVGSRIGLVGLIALIASVAQLSHDSFDNRPWKAVVIHQTNTFAGLVLAGIILALWR